MTETDRDTFLGLLRGLVDLYHVEALSDAALDLYWQALSDLDIRTVERATIAAARASTFFPKPAELRRCAFATSARPATPGPRQLEYRARVTQHGVEALALTKRIRHGDLAGRANLERCVVALWAMHDRWPAFGWDEAARDAAKAPAVVQGSLADLDRGIIRAGGKR